MDLRQRNSCYTKQLRFCSLFLVWSWFAICIPALALDPARSLDQFSYQTWQTGSGLPQNSVHSVVQTRDGFVWIATEGGLVRFDGYQFETFDTRSTPALASNSIRALLEDPEGALWIATAATLCRRKGDRIEAVRDAMPDILALHPDRAGGIWAVTPDALQHWSLNSSRTPLRYPLPEGSPPLTGAIASEPNGSLWLGTQSGVEIWRDGRFGSSIALNLPQQAIESLLLDHSSRLWAGGARGLYEAEISPAPSFHPVCQAARLFGVAVLFEDFERSLWIGTDAGVYRVANASAECEAAKNVTGAVLSITEDAEGDLWAGTESTGITIVRNQKFVTYTSRNGLASDNVRCILETRDNRLWIGGDGLTQLDPRGGATRYTAANGLASNIVLSLGEDSAGDLLIGTPDGLNRWHNGKFSLTTSADGLPDDFVRSLYTDRDGSLWIGTRRGLAHEDRAGHIATYSQADGLGSDLVGAVLRDKRGELWVATLGGLSVLRGHGFQNFRTRDGLSSDVITALYEDTVGDLWIGTQDAGLNLRTQNRFIALPRNTGLPDAVYGIAEDANGELWLASKNGIARVNRADLKFAALGGRGVNAVWYNTSDGLLLDECSLGGHPELWKTHDGTLWFSTLKGAASLSAAAARLNHVLPPVVIESVQIDSRTLRPNAAVHVKAGTSRFAFNYAALSFVAPQKVRYRYRLEGFDKDWIDAGTERSAYYTNIPPGRYSFRVIARNNDGFWNEAGALATFQLAPHYYQTLWFYALCALALAAASYGIYRWRLAEVKARFQAVLAERNRIAREIHDTLAQSFVAVSMQLEIVARLLSVSGEAAREHLDQARTQVREGITEARRAIWQLRSESAEKDFAARVSNAAQQAIGASPVKLSMEVHGTYRPLRADVEEELLKISQEAVKNSLRHAQANRISIELAYAAKKLRMTIADDGVGFTPGPVDSGPNGHFGLRGMRERAEQIHANLEVSSAAGKGTKVLVEAPLNS